MKPNDVTSEIIGAAMSVHSALGPGLLESAYLACLCHELTRRGLRVEKQKALPITYKGLVLDIGYRVDLIVEDLAVVELKAIEKVTPVHYAQVLSYLRLSRRPVGLLINFHAKQLRHGVKRFVNRFPDDRP